MPVWKEGQSRERVTVSTIRVTDGMVASSKMSEAGRGMWSVVIRTIGESRS